MLPQVSHTVGHQQKVMASMTLYILRRLVYCGACTKACFARDQMRSHVTGCTFLVVLLLIVAVGRPRAV